jgi:hypothetical protein
MKTPEDILMQIYFLMLVGLDAEACDLKMSWEVNREITRLNKIYLLMENS